MKKIIFICLLAHCASHAEQYSIEGNINTITKNVYGIKKHADIEGKMYNLALKEDKGQTFYKIPLRTSVSLGYMDFRMSNTNFQTMMLGIDKEIYQNWNKWQGHGFLGIGYKFVDGEGTKNHIDGMLPSKVYIRTGFGLSYKFSNLRVGYKFSHFTNGDTTPGNYDHDFHGINFLYEL